MTALFELDFVVEFDLCESATAERVGEAEHHVQDRFHRRARSLIEVADGSKGFAPASMSVKLLGALPKFFYGTKRRLVFAVRADLQSKIDELVDAVIVGDLQENEGERTDTLLRIFFRAGDATRA